MSPNAVTRTIYPSKGPPYMRCDSDKAFDTSDTHPAKINEALNLNLGLSLDPDRHKTLVYCIKLLNNFFVSWWEKYVFMLLQKLPVEWKRRLQLGLWKHVWLPLHRYWLGTRTGIHPDASEEYHALTTLMYWGRYFPVTVQRMRFSLSQLSTWAPAPVRAHVVEDIAHDMQQETNLVIPESQQDHTVVRGLYLHRTKRPSEYIIFWVYGGAFLSGDAHGNSGPADIIGRTTDTDVFLPSYRLVPEATMDDVLWDITLSYRYLLKVRQVDPSKVIMLGISSGGALCVRLMQFLAEQARGEPLLPTFVEPIVNGLARPKGAVLLGPFVDYTEPRTASFQHYQKHDLIVNQRVIETGIPYLQTHMNGDRTEYSPVHRSLQGLPDLCVVVSRHECVFDQTISLVNRARRDGVRVRLGVWNYMCHVFTFLNSFCPEGEQSQEFVVEWIRECMGKKSVEDDATTKTQ